MNRLFFCVFAVACVCMFTACGGGGSSASSGDICCSAHLGEKLWAELDLNAPPNTLSASEREAGWQLLFDGSTPNGWRGYNMPNGIPDVWAVEDGTLTMNSVGGGEEQDIITNAIYRNFAFSVEYKLSVGSNSGIIYQVKEDPKYTFPYETGPEFQLIDASHRPDRPLLDWQSHGANYAMYPPKARPYNPAGEWNRLMLVVNGDEVIQLINGVEVVRYVKYSDEWNELRDSGKWVDFPDYGKFDEGHIALQNHGTKLWYRSVKLKQL